MADRNVPSRYPQHLAPIAAAVAVAVAGYVLVAVRFGGPLRDAQAAVRQVEQTREQIPSDVEKAVGEIVEARLAAAREVEGEVQRVKAETDQLSRRTNTRINNLDAEIADKIAELRRGLEWAESKAEQAEASALRAVREAEAAKLALAQRPVGTPQAPAASEPNGDAPIHGNVADGQIVVNTVPRGEVFSRIGDFRLDLIRARLGSDGIVLETSITKERGGDGLFQLVIPDRRYDSRIVLADGIELKNGSMIIAGRRASLSTRDHDFDLIEGVPIRVDIIFDGDFQAPVLCRRIELQAFAGNSGQEELMFRFDEVLVSDR